MQTRAMETQLTGVAGRKLDDVWTQGGLAVLTAPAGAGKSFAVEAARRTLPSIVRVTMLPEVRSARGFLWSLGHGLGLKVGEQLKHSFGVPELLAVVLEAIDDKLLVIDRAERVHGSQFQMVQELVDRRGRLALVGSPILRAKVASDEHTAVRCTQSVILATTAAEAKLLNMKHRPAVTLAEALNQWRGTWSDDVIEGVHEKCDGLWLPMVSAFNRNEEVCRLKGQPTAGLGRSEAVEQVEKMRRAA